MSAGTTRPNGSMQHWVAIRPEPAGQFSAQVVGVPELCAVAATRDEAIAQIRVKLSDWLASEQLVPIEVPCPHPALHFTEHLDPNDPLEQEFLEELAKHRRK